MSVSARATRKNVSSEAPPVTIPVALAVVELSRRGNRFFRVLHCPYCGRTDHRHSVPADWQPGDPPGHRVADCATGLRSGAGYELQLVGEGRS